MDDLERAERKRADFGLPMGLGVEDPALREAWFRHTLARLEQDQRIHDLEVEGRVLEAWLGPAPSARERTHYEVATRLAHTPVAKGALPLTWRGAPRGDGVEVWLATFTDEEGTQFAFRVELHPCLGGPPTAKLWWPAAWDDLEHVTDWELLGEFRYLEGARARAERLWRWGEFDLRAELATGAC